MSAPRLLPSVVLALLVGCTPPAPTGALQLTVHLPETTSAGVSRVTVTVWGEGLAPRTTDLSAAAGVWSGQLEALPAGARHTLQAQAFTAGDTPSHEGLVEDVTVSAGAPGLVTLMLQTRSAPPPPAPSPPATTGGADVKVDFNTAPRLAGLTSSQSYLDVGQSTELAVSATDVDGDALRYEWSATCAGDFSKATASRTTFTPSAISAVACNNCQVRVTVEDGRGGFNTAGVALCVTRNAPWRSGQWRVTGFLHTDRDAYHSVAALSTGQVLITGGRRFNTPLANTELYEPTTGYWTPIAPLLTARYGHSSTLLSNGQVLVAGGFNIGTLPYVELYDPVQNAWRSTGFLRTGRSAHAAVALRDGRVLVMGGNHNIVGGLSSAELYQPSSGGWSATGSMSTARYEPQATRLADGRVLVTGGTQQGLTVKTAELYDPATGTWSLTGAMLNPRQGHTSTLLPTGKVLVTGGSDTTGPLTTVELYDPATGTWSFAAPMPAPGGGSAAALLPSGKVLVVGGLLPRYVYQKEARVYDPATDTWSLTVPMNEGRVSPQVLRLSTGHVLVLGGSSAPHRAFSELHFPALEP